MLESANELILKLNSRLGDSQAVEEFKGMKDPIYLGVDIGTANVITVAVSAEGEPLTGEIIPARVVKEGMVVDYFHAVKLVMRQVEAIQNRLGREVTCVASAVPPGTLGNNGRVTRNILEAAGLNVVSIIDEPSAAALALEIKDGAVVDVGGGTTGISVLQEGKVIYTADEATGGHHLDLVIAGGLGISIEEAEEKKRDPQFQKILFPSVRPVFEKIATITRAQLAGYEPENLFLVGGSCAYPGFADLIQKELGIKTYLPEAPLLVTPLGIAMECRNTVERGN